jgi:hypothetical protein
VSDYFYGPALDAELAYRRTALRRDAAEHRLVRLIRRARRTAQR